MKMQGPNDAAANKLGGPKSGKVQPVMEATDSSAMSLGKQGTRSGATGGSSVAPREMSNPWSVSAQGTASAAGPLADKLKSKFRRGE